MIYDLRTPERRGLPSASDMWRNSECHGNRIFIESLRTGDTQYIRDNKQTPEATLGTRIHSSLAGEPEDLERNAQEIRDQSERLATLAAAQFFGGQATRTIIYEQRFWYHVGETPFFSGKPDRVYINSERLLDINFKTGRGDCEDAHLNLQLRTEVVLLKRRYPEVREIGVAIIQPLVTQTPEIAVYDERACHKALIEILEIVDSTAWDETRTAGPWCKFCPARAFCPEARQLALEYPITIRVEALPDGQPASEMLERIEVAEGALKALKSAFKAKVEADPDSVPGWWIGKGKNIRKWKNFKEACIRANQNELDLDAIFEIPFGKLEEECARKWGIKGKELAARFSSEFGNIIEFTRTAGSLERIPKRLRNK